MDYAAFVTLTEAVLGYALTQVSGGVQIALTVFVISFALLVASAFFLILWHRPWVFYPPSEYQNVNPRDFMSALQAPTLSGQIKLAKSLDDNPLDLEARFELIDTMADDAQCQWIIFMHESGKDVRRWAQHIYEYNNGGAGTGTFEGITRSSLLGTGVVSTAGGGQYLRLTDMGHKFAEWLTAKGRKCDYFWSEYGGWGEAKNGGFGAKALVEQAERKMRQEAEQIASSNH